MKRYSVNELIFRIGLKLYSTDIALITEAKKLRDKGLFDYIELYIIPQTPEENLGQWEGLDVPFVIHAAHAIHGINLAQSEKSRDNKKYFAVVKKWADSLKSDWIIAHGGNNGSLDETIRQISLLNDKRVIIENKPKIGILDEACIGWAPADFQRIADEGLLHGMALDFAHAACAAYSVGINEHRMIKDFLFFSPKVFHLSDGHATSEKDSHLNLGKGNRDLKSYINCVPSGGYMTIETPRKTSRDLADFVEDVAFLFQLLDDNEKPRQEL